MAAAALAAAILLGLAFSGSPATLPQGVHVAGVDIGGLTAGEAEALLERRAARLWRVPVTFVAGEHRWRMTPARLGVKADWAAAVAAARRQGDGFAPVRGFRRLHTRFFGSDVVPPARVFDAALRYELDRFARAVHVKTREPAVQLRGLRPVVVAGRPGRALEREAAARVVVRSLASFSRAPVGLPVRVRLPRIEPRELEHVAAQAATAVSAPVRLALGPTRWRLPRWWIAKVLALPRDGRRKLAIGGPTANAWFVRLRRRVDRPPRNADFAVRADGTVGVVPAREGLAVDVRATADALLAAALSPHERVARLVVATAQPERTTAEARAMGITRLVKAYTTSYGGEPNRLHNVRLVAQLIDGALIAPGATFSFNATTGERTAEKGFLEAPVIINGELRNGLGGGVCQVSTTVFNAAYEAGLPIVARTNHALYIDHYPLGRDATVNYPDLDLRFRNDTGRWLLLRTWVGPSSLTVALYGRPSARRVVSETTPLVETGGPGARTVADPSLYVGERVVEDDGEPSRTTSVRRRVYAASGKLLYDTTWRSYYRSEPQLIRVGTKPRPAPEPKPKREPKGKPKPSRAEDDPGLQDPAPETARPQPSPEPTQEPAPEGPTPLP